MAQQSRPGALRAGVCVVVCGDDVIYGVGWLRCVRSRLLPTRCGCELFSGSTSTAFSSCFEEAMVSVVGSAVLISSVPTGNPASAYYREGVEGWGWGEGEGEEEVDYWHW